MTMNNMEFVAKLREIVDKHKTLYVMGCFGAPLNGGNVDRYCQNHNYNRTPERTRMIRAAANKQPPVYGFDCVCLIKGVLWGWAADPGKTYGGAQYASNNVPDIGADSMIRQCKSVSSDFSHIEVGEAVWKPGHIGVYIGNGFAIECTPSWHNCVQITACNCDKSGYFRRNWSKHGKLPYIDYVVQEKPKPAEPVKKSIETVAREVLDGKWGNGSERKKRLAAAGYDPEDVQKKVNELLKKPSEPAKKSIEEVACEVINGKWGNGADRRNRLAAAGYDYAAVQRKVNELLK